MGCLTVFPLPTFTPGCGGAAGNCPRVRPIYYRRVYRHSPEGQWQGIVFRTAGQAITGGA